MPGRSCETLTYIPLPLVLDNVLVDTFILQLFSSSRSLNSHEQARMYQTSRRVTCVHKIFPMAATKPKPIEWASSGSVIVYDLSSQTITTQKAEKFKGMYFNRYVLSRAHHKI